MTESNFQAGVETNIFICPKTHKGEIHKQYVDQVEVLIEPVDQVASLTINEEFSGTLRVKFVPKVPGAYNITAKINGEKLANSPLKIQVKERHRIQQFTGNRVKIFGQKGTGEAEFKKPTSICMDDQGHFVVAEFSNNRVQVLTKDGTPVSKFGDSGPGKLDEPQGCVFHKDMFIVSDYGSKCLKLFDSSGTFLRKIGEEGEADGQFKDPWGLCIDGHGNILECDYETGVLQQFSIEGRFTGKSVAKLQTPRGIAVMPDGRFLVSDDEEHEVFILK